MNFVTKIRMAMAYLNINNSELSRRLEMTPQALNSKFKTDKYTVEDMEKFASAMGAEFFYGFKMKDGTII